MEPPDHNDHPSAYGNSACPRTSRMGHHSDRRKLLHQPPSFEKRHFQGELHPGLVSLQVPLCHNQSLVESSRKFCRRYGARRHYMSDCCSVSAKSGVRRAVEACPVTRTPSKRVNMLTVKRLVRKLPMGMPTKQYYFFAPSHFHVVFFPLTPEPP